MNFILFSSIHWDWDAGIHWPPQIALQFARQGHTVHFIQPQPPAQSVSLAPGITLSSLKDLGLSDRAVGRAWYGLDPGPLHHAAENLLAMQRRLEKPDEPRVAVWFAPFEPFVRMLPVLRSANNHLLYCPVDDYDDLIRLGDYHHHARAHEFLIHETDLVFTFSQVIAEKMRRSGKAAAVLARGIDLKEFRHGAGEQVGAMDVLRGEHTLGFWGYMDSVMVDADALAFVARARPQWAINLLGDYAEEFQFLKSFPNVRLHGYVPHSQLRAYAEYFDVCLIPAPDNGVSRGREPIKLYEYLAAYKPTVCTHMPHLADKPYVWAANSPEEFVQYIETALRAKVEPAVIDEFLSQHTWSAATETMLSRVEALPPRVASMEPNEQLLATGFGGEKNWKPYVELLERELAETRQWAREVERAVLHNEAELNRFRRFSPRRLVSRGGRSEIQQ